MIQRHTRAFLRVWSALTPTERADLQAQRHSGESMAQCLRRRRPSGWALVVALTSRAI